MTTTIAPSLGHGVLMTQAGTGTSPGFDAIDVRRMTLSQQGEGVSTYESWRVRQRGASANMSVDIGADEVAYVRGDAVALQAPYAVAPHSATINEAITTADPTNPRLDMVILELKDATHDASGFNVAQTRVVAGTPTAGATLDNRNGAAAMPASAILLADVIVAANDTSITDAEIRDRRPFVSGIPPLLTDVDQVPLLPYGVPIATQASEAPADLLQVAHLVQVPRRIVGATRIRWRYQQGTPTAATGTYCLALYDSSGRLIVGTGAVAFTGAAASVQARSETIAATTVEAGVVYLMFGVDYTNSPNAFTWAGARGSAWPNAYLRSLTGGAAAPNTLLSFTDVGASTFLTTDDVPVCALSVG